MPFKTETIKTESELITRLKEQDKASFEGLFDKYSPLALSLFKELNLNEEKTEEVLLTCFVNISNNIQKFDPTKQRLFTWILTELKSTLNDICAVEKEQLQIQKIKNYVQQNRDLSDPGFIRLLILHGGNLDELAVLSGVTKQELTGVIKNNLNQLKK